MSGKEGAAGNDGDGLSGRNDSAAQLFDGDA